MSTAPRSAAVDPEDARITQLFISMLKRRYQMFAAADECATVELHKTGGFSVQAGWPLREMNRQAQAMPSMKTKLEQQALELVELRRKLQIVKDTVR